MFRANTLAWRLLAAAGAAATAGSAAAFTMVPLDGESRPELPMLDARVNAHDAYARALSARPGLSAASAQTTRLNLQNTATALLAWKVNMPGLRVTLSNTTGSPRQLSNSAGVLTAPAPGERSIDIVKNFLADHGAVYGLDAGDIKDLVALGDSAGGSSGLRMLRLEQRVDGVPVFQSESRFLIDRDGSLVKTLGPFVPHARAIAPAVNWSQLMKPEQAVARLLGAQGRQADAALFGTAGESEGWLRLASADDFVPGDVSARKVLFPLGPGMLVPGWALVVFTQGNADWYAVVDAQTGDVLWRKNIRASASTHDARFRVYVQADGTTPADSPAPQSPNTVAPGSGTQFPAISPTIVSMHTAMDPVASPNGWIDDCPAGGCTANETQTLGNNALVCMDQATPTNVCDTGLATVIDGNGRPTGNPDANSRNRDFLGTAPRDFQTNFLPPPQAGNPEAGQTATGNGSSGTAAIDQFRRGMITHLFYVTNWYHDKLYALGFDEASGNFQQTNFSGQGVGGDRVLGDADDGSGTNNANFSTPPDGTSGRMQMYRFTGATIDRDGGLDQEISMHEMTHGTSNRLVGDGAGLNWEPAGGMGEGWSDFYALSLLNNTAADDANGRYASGGYATYKLSAGYLDNYVYGIRRFPYSADKTINPLTWADVDDVTNDLSGGITPTPLTFNLNGGMEVHNIGEVWAVTLWDVRKRVISDPAGANGDVPTGNHTMLQLVTDGLKATPIDPSFVEARDALLDADCATNACANENSIWGGFANRDLGYGAKTPYNVSFGYFAGHMAVETSNKLPYLDVANAATDVVVNDAATNNNGKVDAGEVVRLSVKLTNPWRGAAKAATGVSATLSTATPGVTIYDASSSYGAIAPQGTAIGDDFIIGVGAGVVCGSAIDFTLTTTSSLGTTSTAFRLRVGTPSGTDPVVTYTGSASAVAIPDQRPRGITNAINITDDLEIADLDFRVNSITHPAVGDITAMLRSPNGLGVDLVALIGGTIGIGGANITNMVVDDDVANTTANDMVQAANTAAPYTKSWTPVYNGPWSTAVGFPADDPVGNLSRYDGLSTKGTWTTLISDQLNTANGGGGAGTFSGWSMLVTPRHFTCAAVPAATVNLTATKTVAGTFKVGTNVTYTITLTNNGTGLQADNAGNEFTDALPAGLTLVSAVATSGTASTAGNTVNWNGSLAPLGGSVTITITASINAGALGTTVSNQGTVSYDADVNGSNESTLLTDDPAVAGAADPTTFFVHQAKLALTKTVSGTRNTGDTMTYTIVISNSGDTASPNLVSNELTDILPASLALVDASATAGTATATIGTNTVTWNGSVPAGGSVTVTIHATVATHDSIAVSNQAAVQYDADLDGIAEAAVLSDDPLVGGAADPTVFTAIGDRIFADDFE